MRRHSTYRLKTAPFWICSFLRNVRDPKVMIEDARLLQELVARCAVHDRAALQNDRLVGDLEDLMSMLLHDDPRKTFFAKESVQCAEKFLDNNWGEPFGWFIQQQNLRVEDECAPNRQHLLLAA